MIPQTNCWLAVRNGKRLLIPSPKGDWGSFIVDYNKARFINYGDIVVAAGACVGATTLSIAHKAGKVIAIEPNPKNLLFLRRNVKAYGYKNVIVVGKALYSFRGKVKLYITSTITGHSILQLIALRKPFTGEYVEVQADTLDNILTEIGVEKVDVLIMNIEGAELEALKGAEETLKKIKKISIACHGDIKGCVCNFLKERGFVVKSEMDLIYARRGHQF
jgi:FkbM family methyltransferase